MRDSWRSSSRGLGVVLGARFEEVSYTEIGRSENARTKSILYSILPSYYLQKRNAGKIYGRFRLVREFREFAERNWVFASFRSVAVENLLRLSKAYLSRSIEVFRHLRKKIDEESRGR